MKLRRLARPVDFDAFHWALALRGTGRAAAAAAEGLPPLALRTPRGTGWTYRVHESELVATAGVADDAATLVELDTVAFGDFATELVTAAGLEVTGRIAFERGTFGDLDAWEPALRTLYHGRPVFDPEGVDRSELGRTFVWGMDPDTAIAAFLARHGFAVVHGVFAGDVVARVAELVETETRGRTVGEDPSWWADGPHGSPVLCQAHRVPGLHELETDPRILRLVAAAGRPLVSHGSCGSGHVAVVKHPGGLGGLADLPWHVDCGLGGHPVLCPGLQVGIHLTEVTRATGALGFLAGSHRSAAPRPPDALPEHWPVVWVHAAPGDVTLHLTDVLHAAPAPTGPGGARRSLYLSFGREDTRDWLGTDTFDELLFADASAGHLVGSLAGGDEGGVPHG